MNYSLLFAPDVEHDVLDGYAWYAEKADGLGDEFLRTFLASSREIQRNPHLNNTVYKTFRRRLLRRFPYALYFVIEPNSVHVLGLFHCARNPSAIRNALDSRGGV